MVIGCKELDPRVYMSLLCRSSYNIAFCSQARMDSAAVTNNSWNPSGLTITVYFCPLQNHGGSSSTPGQPLAQQRLTDSFWFHLVTAPPQHVASKVAIAGEREMVAGSHIGSSVHLFGSASIISAHSLLVRAWLYLTASGCRNTGQNMLFGEQFAPWHGSLIFICVSHFLPLEHLYI